MVNTFSLFTLFTPRTGNSDEVQQLTLRTCFNQRNKRVLTYKYDSKEDGFSVTFSDVILERGMPVVTSFNTLMKK